VGKRLRKRRGYRRSLRESALRRRRNRGRSRRRREGSRRKSAGLRNSRDYTRKL
jgi:hypothetical protein